MISIRKATLADSNQLISLVEQLGYKLNEETMKKNINAYIQLPNRELIVAEMDGNVIGCLALDLLPTFHAEEKQMRIISLVVDQLCRGKGIGRFLLHAAEDIAKKEQCWMIELTSSSRREKDGTHAFYINEGYAKNGNQAYFRKYI